MDAQGFLTQGGSGGAYILPDMGINPLEQAQGVKAWDAQQGALKAAQDAKAKDQQLKQAKLLEYDLPKDFLPQDYQYFVGANDNLTKWAADQMQQGHDLTNPQDPAFWQFKKMQGTISNAAIASKNDWALYQKNKDIIASNPDMFEPESMDAMESFYMNPDIGKRSKMARPDLGEFFKLDQYIETYGPSADKTAWDNPANGYIWGGTLTKLGNEKISEWSKAQYTDPLVNKRLKYDISKMDEATVNSLTESAKKNGMPTVEAELLRQRALTQLEKSEQTAQTTAESGGGFGFNKEVETANNFVDLWAGLTSGREDLFSDKPQVVDGRTVMYSDKLNGYNVGVVDVVEGTGKDAKTVSKPVHVTGFFYDKNKGQYTIETDIGGQFSWGDRKGSYGNMTKFAGEKGGFSTGALDEALKRKGEKVTEGAFEKDLAPFLPETDKGLESEKYKQAKENFNTILETGGDAQKAADEMMAVSPGGIVSPDGKTWKNPTNVTITPRSGGQSWDISFKTNGELHEYKNVNKTDLNGLFPAPKNVQPNAKPKFDPTNF